MQGVRKATFHFSTRCRAMVITKKGCPWKRVEQREFKNGKTAKLFAVRSTRYFRNAREAYQYAFPRG